MNISHSFITFAVILILFQETFGVSEQRSIEKVCLFEYFLRNIYFQQQNDEVPSEVADTNDEILKESLDENNNVAVSDPKDEAGGSSSTSLNVGGLAVDANSPQAILGKIGTVKQIAEILEQVVGEIVLPVVVDSQQKSSNANETGSTVTASATNSIKYHPKGLKLLQHHSAITSNIENEAKPDEK